MMRGPLSARRPLPGLLAKLLAERSIRVARLGESGLPMLSASEGSDALA